MTPVGPGRFGNVRQLADVDTDIRYIMSCARARPQPGGTCIRTAGDRPRSRPRRHPPEHRHPGGVNQCAVAAEHPGIEYRPGGAGAAGVLVGLPVGDPVSVDDVPGARLLLRPGGVGIGARIRHRPASALHQLGTPGHRRRRRDHRRHRSTTTGQLPGRSGDHGGLHRGVRTGGRLGPGAAHPDALLHAGRRVGHHDGPGADRPDGGPSRRPGPRRQP